MTPAQITNLTRISATRWKTSDGYGVQAVALKSRRFYLVSAPRKDADGFSVLLETHAPTMKVCCSAIRRDRYLLAQTPTPRFGTWTVESDDTHWNSQRGASRHARTLAGSQWIQRTQDSTPGPRLHVKER